MQGTCLLGVWLALVSQGERLCPTPAVFPLLQRGGSLRLEGEGEGGVGRVADIFLLSHAHPRLAHAQTPPRHTLSLREQLPTDRAHQEAI